MVSTRLGVGGPGAGCSFSPCLMIRFRSTSITCSAGRDAARVEASVLPASMPVAEGGEGVRPNVAVFVTVVVLPVVGTPVVVEGEEEGTPRGVDGMTVTLSGPSLGADRFSGGEPSESVFSPLVRDLVNWRRREEGIGNLEY